MKIFKSNTAFVFLNLFIWQLSGLANPSQLWQSKVDPVVLENIAYQKTGFLLFLTEQADLSESASFSTKLEKGEYVFTKLKEVADQTQPQIVKILTQNAADFRQFWVINMIWVKGDIELLETLASRTDVAFVYADTRGRLERALLEKEPPEPLQSSRTVEWNIDKINAPQVWAEGITGEGAVVGVIDTGFQWEHPALVNQYRGWNGEVATHDYNWHDAIHSGGNVNCPSDSPEPCDGGSHGTYVLGIAIGDDGGNNQIGVAPGAKWIGCRCWEPVQRTHISYVTECLQWMIAPTNINGENPDPAKAPHVINNSWVCEPDEGCQDPNALKMVIENVRAAGIVVLGGSGNNGPNCSSSAFPPAIYEAYFSVGASTNNDAIADFSSRGPILIDGSNRSKPDITAPGQNIRSSDIANGYGNGSGTSAAGPHVAGLVALLISANPGLAGNVDLIENIITRTAVVPNTSQVCGTTSELPNSVFGWGRIDAFAAYQDAISVITSISDQDANVVPDKFRLLPNMPNPFNPSTIIRYEVPIAGFVEIKIFNMVGQQIRLLYSGQQTAGVHQIHWDGRKDDGALTTSGIYLYRLKTKAFSKTRKMTLIR